MVYEVVKGITAISAIVGLVVIAISVERVHLDGVLLTSIVALIGALGGIYLSDVTRKLNGR